MLLPGTFPRGVEFSSKLVIGRRPNRIQRTCFDSGAWPCAIVRFRVGTFILGTGFYSIPRLRKLKPLGLWEGWLCWSSWVVGVTTRWLSNIYLWQCRIMMLTSAVHEVLAFLIFFQAVASHRPLRGIPKPWESWIVVVIAASLGLLVSLM